MGWLRRGDPTAVAIGDGCLRGGDVYFPLLLPPIPSTAKGSGISPSRVCRAWLHDPGSRRPKGLSPPSAPFWGMTPILGSGMGFLGPPPPQLLQPLYLNGGSRNPQLRPPRAAVPSWARGLSGGPTAGLGHQTPSPQRLTRPEPPPAGPKGVFGVGLCSLRSFVGVRGGGNSQLPREVGSRGEL